MARQSVVVRVVVFEEERAPATLALWLEQFRYAGWITWHERGVAIEGERRRHVFDLHCPHGRRPAVWAADNASRLRSYGINAVVAWSTDDVDPGQVLDESRKGGTR